MQLTLDDRSLKRLVGVNPALVAVVNLAIQLTAVDFIVTEGIRSRKRQVELFKLGATRTLNSRHLTGHAVDLAATVGGKVRWDWPLYSRIAAAMKEAAGTLHVPISWGGDWKSFKDGPHFELPRNYTRGV